MITNLEDMVKIVELRYQRAREALEKNGFDAWLILGRESNILGQPSLLYMMHAEVMNRTAIIVTRDGRRIVLSAAIEMEEKEGSGIFTDTVVYRGCRGFVDKLTEALASLMPMNKLAVDMSVNDPSSDGMSHSDFLLVEECLKKIGFAGELVSSEPVMKLIRGKKSDLEVQKIAYAVQKAMEVFDEARPQMRVGMSGYDVEMLFQRIMRGHGYGFTWNELSNPFVSVGARSSYLCKRPPKDVFIQPGDLVNVDLGMRVDGFSSDNQRSFYALRPGETEPPAEVTKAWKTIQRMNREVCAAMKTGYDSDLLTEIGHRIMLDSGYPDGWPWSYGHELGVFATTAASRPGRTVRLTKMDTILEENMTFTLEPSIITPMGRLCQEEVVRVTKDGGQMLSTPQTEVWLITE